jgi:hypothetical protein
MHDIDTNSSEVGSLKRAASLAGCCCSDNASLFVEFKLCPNCVAETQCSCSSTYDYRAGKGSDSNDTGCGSVDPDTSEFECSGRSIGGSNCTSCADIDCGAVYIRRDAFLSVVFAENSSGDPYYFDTLPTASSYYDSSTGNLKSLPTPYVGVKIRLTLASGKEVVTAATITDLKAPFSQVNDCNIIDGTDNLFVRDCAGNIPLYGSGGYGINTTALIGGASGTINSGESLCKAICEHRFYLDSVECDQSCGSCNLPGNISNVYNFHSAEFALGKYHLGCSSCSGCNPAKASNKAVTTTASTTHCLGNKAYFLDPENSVQDVDPFNIVAGNSDFNNNGRCGKEFDGDARTDTNDCGGNPSGDIQGPFAHHINLSGPGLLRNLFGAIDCSITCGGSTKNSPFADCGEATSDGLTNCNALDCSCCCNPFTQTPNVATTYAVTFPDISFGAGTFPDQVLRSPYCCGENPVGSPVADCWSPSTCQPTLDSEGDFNPGALDFSQSINLCTAIGGMTGGTHTIEYNPAFSSPSSGCSWTTVSDTVTGNYTTIGSDMCAAASCSGACDPDFWTCKGPYRFRLEDVDIFCFGSGGYNLFARYNLSNDGGESLATFFIQYEQDTPSTTPAGAYSSVLTGTTLCGVNLATLTCTVS